MYIDSTHPAIYIACLSDFAILSEENDFTILAYLIIKWSNQG